MRRRLIASSILAVLAAVVVASLADLRGLFGPGWFAPPVRLSLSDATPDQCSVSGDVLTSSGNDAKLVWGGFSSENVHLCVEAEAGESVFLEVFWGVPDQPAFSPNRRISRALFAGKNRTTVPLSGKVAGLRLDFGNSPGQRFRIRSVVAATGPYCARPWHWRVFFLRTAVLFFPFLLLAVHLFFPAVRIWSFVDRNRFSLVASVLAFAVLFEVHGSSIGMWNRYLPNDRAEAPLFGTERPIRSDEWAVFAPMTLAQFAADPAFPYFNDIPRAMPTDMYSVYAQPVRHPLLVFRPFLAGYVLFGFERGLAFFWFGRWLALLLLAYELFKLLTEGDKPLSGIASLLVVLSPVVQWWGAINALAEMLLFGSLFVLCLDRFMAGRGLRDRWLPVLGLGYSGVCYAMTLYPAAMVPLAYVFGALCLWTIVRRAAGFHLDSRSVLFAILVFTVAAGCLAWYLRLSSDSFGIVSGTEYPGKRFECGGGFQKGLGLSLGGLFFPWTSHWIEDGNSFDRSMFLDFFPLGIGLSAFVLLRRGVRDVLLMLLLLVSAVLGAYCVFGLPPWMAKVSLLSRSIAPRAFVVFSFVQFLLIVRSVALIRPAPSLRAAAASALAFSVGAALLAHWSCPNYLPPPRLLVVWAVGFSACLLFLRFRVCRFTSCAFFSALAVAAGAFVNPVQRGDAGVSGSELFRAIRSMAGKGRGAWLVEGAPFPLNQYPLLVGVPTVNAGNLYPALERWRGLDLEETAKETWNRYAVGIRFDLKPHAPTTFLRTGLDTFRVGCSPDVLRQLGVRCVLSRNRLEPLSANGIRFQLLRSVAGWNIYELDADDAPDRVPEIRRPVDYR